MTTGAELAIETAVELGTEICFANPGTTELPLVQALDSRSGIRGVLGLHENVCTGAADGYARIAGKPALTLLHLGPGFANGIANLHNARRAFSPVINLVGEHASWHLSADPPLHSDIESLSRPVSSFTRRVMDPNAIGRDLKEAYASATSLRGGVSTLILPHDHQLTETQPLKISPVQAKRFPQLDDRLVEQAAQLLEQASRPAILLGGQGLFGRGLKAAGQIGVQLIGEVSFAKLETGLGRPNLMRLPYFPDQAKALLDQYDAVIVCGTKMPVSFFGYEGVASRYLDGRADVVLLAGQEDDAIGALEALAERIGRKNGPADAQRLAMPSAGSSLDASKLATIVTALLPEEAISVVTAVSSAQPFYEQSVAAAPHTQIALTGGAIGEGSALSLGAAIASPDRPVVALEADGSAAYIVQGLYSHAKEGLNVTTIICSNRRYNILDLELKRAGVTETGPEASKLSDLGNPPLDWVALAKGFGVSGFSASTVAEMEHALHRALASEGPCLIEAVL